AQCKATESASTVRSLIAATQQKLESRAATAQAGAVMPQPGRSLSIIADRLSTQNDSQALYRLLYQVERELSSLRRRDSGTTTERAARSQHMRVPACEESPGKAAGLWLSLIADQLGRSTPVLVLVP